MTGDSWRQMDKWEKTVETRGRARTPGAAALPGWVSGGKTKFDSCFRDDFSRRWVSGLSERPWWGTANSGGGEGREQSRACFKLKEAQEGEKGLPEGTA